MKKIRVFLLRPLPSALYLKMLKIFDVQNPIIGNLIVQVNANQIGEQEVKELFSRAEDEKIHRRLDVLRRYDNGGDNGEDEGPGLGPPPPPPTFSPTFPTQQQRPIPPPRPPRFLPPQPFSILGRFIG